MRQQATSLCAALRPCCHWGHAVQIEAQRQVQQQAAAEAQARSRVAKVQTDLEQRTAALERQAVAAGEAGRLIEAHADAVDAAILAVNGQLATGIAWPELERYGSVSPPPPPPPPTPQTLLHSVAA